MIYLYEETCFDLDINPTFSLDENIDRLALTEFAAIGRMLASVWDAIKRFVNNMMNFVFRRDKPLSVPATVVLKSATIGIPSMPSELALASANGIVNFAYQVFTEIQSIISDIHTNGTNSQINRTEGLTSQLTKLTTWIDWVHDPQNMYSPKAVTVEKAVQIAGELRSTKLVLRANWEKLSSNFDTIVGDFDRLAAANHGRKDSSQDQYQQISTSFGNAIKVVADSFARLISTIYRYEEKIAYSVATATH